MRYSISGDDLIWLLRMAGANGHPERLKDVLYDVSPITTSARVSPPRDLTDEEMAEIAAIPVPPAKPE